MIIFELWDIETANLVGAYETEAEALAVVRQAIAAYGVGYADGLALLGDDEAAEESQTIAVGAQLAERALVAATETVVGAAGP